MKEHAELREYLGYLLEHAEACETPGCEQCEFLEATCAAMHSRMFAENAQRVQGAGA